MRRTVSVIVAVACGCSSPPAHRERPVTPAVARPKLVVVIVIDQLPTWVFERDRTHFTGGFARLLREAAYVPAATLPYANTFTAVGHAAIGTGAPPAVTGIVGNTWYSRADEREHAAELDRDAPPLIVGPSLGGTIGDDDAASGHALRVGGVAEQLRAATHGRGKSVAIGLKARAAVFVVGKRPDLAVWYEPAAGGMTTSKAYAEAPPAWLVELARAKPASRYFTQVWTPLDAKLLADVTGIPDDAPGEGSDMKLGRAFPHDLGASDAPHKAIVHTPFADELELETALAAIAAYDLGRGGDDVPDLLAISFSAHDYAGHLWGPDSWEVLDLTLRLDRLLAQLFDALDAKVGRDGWAAVVTSDHGATPLVERSQRGRRIPTAEIAAAADAAIAKYLGDGKWVAKIVSNNVWLVPAFARAAGDREAALDDAAAAIAKLPNIAMAGRTDRIAHDCAKRADLERAICLSVVDGSSGELFAVATAGSLITDYATGTHHDAPFADNRRVPAFVRAPGLAPTRGEGTILQIAPTVAALLGVPPPEAATEQPLFGLK